jgi:hypothetical protein
MSSTNTFCEIDQYGQNIWLDHIHRQLIRLGTLKDMIQHQGLTPITSNHSTVALSKKAYSIPLETLHSFLNHGKVADTLESNRPHASPWV